MSIYNILKAEIKCPRCSEMGEQQIALYFGYRNEMLEFQIGDKYVWRKGKEVQNGGEPENGNFNGEGYVECRFCQKDFWAKIKIRNNVITNVGINLAKEPYIKN